MSKRETTEQMLSRMACERDEREAAKRGLTVAELKQLQRKCQHPRIKRGCYVDECLECDAALPC